LADYAGARAGEDGRGWFRISEIECEPPTREVGTAHGRAAGLSARADQARLEAYGRWDAVQQSWSDHVRRFRAKIDERRAELDERNAAAQADDAEAYAAYAIDFAVSAIEEAEYAVLDAQLARMEADERSAG
jgi:hypothetical protein